MAHSLLARDRAAGTVTVLLPVSFDRTDDAIEAARELVASGAVDPESSEILVVDLTSASRLEFITLSAPVDDQVTEDVDLSPAAGVWETPAEVSTSIATVDEPESASTLELVEQPDPEPSPELEPEPEPEPEIAPEPEPEPIVAEPAPEPMPQPAPLPWPEPTAQEPAIAETPSAPDVAPEPSEPPAIPEVTIVETLPVVELDVGPYEVSGELVLDRYTCDDCVYANTCPKVGESAPVECGSFQWKAL